MLPDNDTQTTKDTSELTDTTLAPGQIVLANVKQLDAEGNAVISFFLGGKSYEQVAMTTVALKQADIGRQVAVSFLNSNIEQALILGVIYSPFYEYLDQVEVAPASSEQEIDEQDDAIDLQHPVKVDGKNVVIEGKDQVELRCGEASITLTKSGKVLIRGKYLLNRASGVNRIIGGSVQVN